MHMTKVQRQKHIDAINSLLEQNGYGLNRYGKYQNGDISIDTREINFKVTRGDFKLYSKPMTFITIDEVQRLIERWNV